MSTRAAAAGSAKLDWRAPRFQGRRFAFAGRLKNQDFVLHWIAKEGGKVAAALTDKANYLIVGPKRSSKPSALEKRARKLNQGGATIQVIQERDFWKLLAVTRDEALDMLQSGKRGRQRWNDLRPNIPRLRLREAARWDNVSREQFPVLDLSGARLRGADLRGLSLAGVKFDDADLRGADLRDSTGLKARQANLELAILTKATVDTLLACNLRGSQLADGWIFYGVAQSDFTGANLERVHVSGSGVEARFRNARMREAEFSISRIGFTAEFQLIDFRGADFRGADLSNARLYAGGFRPGQNANFAGANFSGANLSDANLALCDLSGAKFRRANLTRAALVESQLHQADFREATLRDARLPGADLTGANLDGAHFTGANVFDAKFDAVDTTRVKGWPAPAPAIVAAGPHIQRLEDTVRQSESASISARVALPGQPTLTLPILTWSRRQRMWTAPGLTQARKLAELFPHMAGRWGWWKQVLDSLTLGDTGLRSALVVDIKNGPVRKTELAPLVGAALCEAFAVTPPTQEERQARKLAAGPIDFDTLMQNLEVTTDAAKLAKALKMLKADRFRLFADVMDDSLIGVVKSQTDGDLVYSCRLAADGSFGCGTQNLKPCGGLQGSLCKHLLVLVVGLSKAGQLDPGKASEWVAASQAQKPTLDKDITSETFLRYKGAEAGEVDWRPTETIPEDYYAL